MDKEYDIVLLGATGYTGTLIALALGELREKDKQIKWAIAGRNSSKMEQLLKDILSENPALGDHPDVECINADVDLPETLNDMASKARIVINCVGPYAYNGERVVLACIKGKAHYLDVSGETIFLESMQLKYNESAKSVGIFVVGALGFDSVPAELGVQYTVQHFPGLLNEVECFVKPNCKNVNFATYESAVNSFKNVNELRRIRAQLYTKPVPEIKHRLAPRGLMSHESTVSSWCLPFPGTDNAVVYRSQRRLYESGQLEAPVQFRQYLCVNGFFSCLGGILGGAIFAMLCKFQCGRNLLLKHYRPFTFGHVTKIAPSVNELKENSFVETFIGRGYSKDHRDPSNSPPDTTIVTRVTGPEPYLATAKCIVQAAHIILRERASLPPQGGVFSPAAAFWKTNFIDRLNREGFVFETLSTNGKTNKKKD